MATHGIYCCEALMMVLAASTTFLLIPCAAAAADKDTLTFGGSITGDQTRSSKNGIFKLGFFNLDDTSRWYLGIWYATVPEQTIAWVANRNSPVPSNSALLNITATGGLLLSYQGSSVWSASGISKRPSSAVIGNDGNLVVLGNENNNEVLWQSFDMPGHTWLPGMKISNRKTERLTSWKSPSDPSDGPFNLQMDPSGENSYVLMWNHSVKYWYSGVWTGTLFSNLPEMSQNGIYKFSFFDNGTYKYFTYSVKPDQSVISRIEMHHSGEARQYMVVDNKWSMFWAQPKDQCDVYGVCGAYGSCNNVNVQSCSCVLGFQPKDSKAWESQDWSGGCVRKNPLNCVQNKPNGTDTDGFTALTSQSMPDNGVVLKNNVNEQGCRSSCSSNCSCTAYAVTGNNKCTLWFGDLINLREQSVNSSLNLRLNPKDLEVLNKKKRNPAELRSGGHNKIVIGGTTIGCIAAIAGICILLVILCRRKARAQLIAKSTSGSLRVFSFRDLQVATKNFSDRLGGGGFGSVFKGTLKDNTVIAVKKLEGSSQGEKQFRMEVSTIGTVQHLNLVRLRGFCSEGKNRLLVYEYIPNGSLSSVLFGHGQPHKVLDWKTRYAIMVGTARGMVYLHEQCRECIIHCDIKPENILLDEKFKPKIADFGLAKLLGREFSQVLTSMRGTRGYWAPEWLSGLPITTKADVYSYGMTLLEIISGHRNLSKMNEGDSDMVFYPAWAATDIGSGNVMKVVDKRVQGDADTEEVRRAGTIAMWCVQDDENERPSMREVLQVLEGVADMPPPPVPLSFQGLNHEQPASLVGFWTSSTIDDYTSSGNANSPSTLK